MGSLRQRRSPPHLHLFPGLPPQPLPQQSGVVGTRLTQATPTSSTRPSKPCAGPRPLENPRPHPWTHLCRPLLRHCPLWKAGSEYLCLPACPFGCLYVSVPVSDPTLLSVCLSCTFPSLCVSVCNSLLVPVSASLGLSLQISVSISLSLCVCLSLHLSPPLCVPVQLQFSPSTFLCLSHSGSAGALCPPDFHLLLRLWLGWGGRSVGRGRPRVAFRGLSERTEGCVC